MCNGTPSPYSHHASLHHQRFTCLPRFHCVSHSRYVRLAHDYTLTATAREICRDYNRTLTRPPPSRQAFVHRYRCIVPSLTFPGLDGRGASDGPPPLPHDGDGPPPLPDAPPPIRMLAPGQARARFLYRYPPLPTATHRYLLLPNATDRYLP